MNARQKAKKYKRMYEKLLKQPQPIEVKVGYKKIDTLRFERYYPEPLITQDNIYFLRNYIVKDIAHSLAENLDKYIDYYTEFCPHTNEYRIYGEIKVIEKEKG